MTLMATVESSIATTAASSERPARPVLGKEVGVGKPPNDGERRKQA